jgi:hypothetical protein
MQPTLFDPTDPVFDDAAIQIVGTGPSITVPNWLLWLELLFLVLAMLLALVLLIRQRNLRAFCLLAATTVIAAGQAFDMLPVLFMHSEAAYRAVVFFMPVLWIRWLGPCFLAVYAFLTLREGRTLRVGDFDS